MTKRQLEEIIRKEVRRRLNEEVVKTNELIDAYNQFQYGLLTIINKLEFSDDPKNLAIFKKIDQLFRKSDLGKKI